MFRSLIEATARARTEPEPRPMCVDVCPLWRPGGVEDLKYFEILYFDAVELQLCNICGILWWSIGVRGKMYLLASQWMPSFWKLDRVPFVICFVYEWNKGGSMNKICCQISYRAPHYQQQNLPTGFSCWPEKED